MCWFLKYILRRAFFINVTSCSTDSTTFLLISKSCISKKACLRPSTQDRDYFKKRTPLTSRTVMSYYVLGHLISLPYQCYEADPLYVETVQAPLAETETSGYLLGYVNYSMGLRSAIHNAFIGSVYPRHLDRPLCFSRMVAIYGLWKKGVQMQFRVSREKRGNYFSLPKKSRNSYTKGATSFQDEK